MSQGIVTALSVPSCKMADLIIFLYLMTTFVYLYRYSDGDFGGQFLNYCNC